MAAEHEDLATILFSKQPFTPAQIESFTADVNRLGFKIIYTPTERKNKFVQIIATTGKRDLFYEKYPFDVRPPTDDRPFFFNVLKLKDFLKVSEVQEGQMFNYYATYTLMIILFLAIIAGLLTFFLPFFIRRIKEGAFLVSWRVLAYFACIGLAYLMVEIVLIQRLILLLKNPAYSAAGVVAGMLIASGIGSLVWGFTRSGGKSKLYIVAGAIVAVGLLFHITIGGSVIHALVGQALPVKLLVAALMILPLGWAMGIPLPAGLSSTSITDERSAVWSWGINGAASIIGAPLAVVIAMGWGYKVVLVVCLLLYLIAFVNFVSMSLRKGVIYH